MFYQEKSPTYKDCKVHEEWHNFQTFAEWFNDNYYEVDNERMHLDKDILVKGNKVYSSYTCLFVPQRINELFVKKVKADNLPIGVKFHTRDKIYESSCNYYGKPKYLGRYDNPKDAFYLGYKPFKENYIKEIANDYKNRIPNELYTTMINYKIEIND